MKKLLLSAGLLLLLTGCGSGGADSKKADSSSSDTKTSSVAKKTKESTTASSAAEINALKELTTKYPDVQFPTDIPRDESRALNIASAEESGKLSVLYYIMDQPMVMNDINLNHGTPFASYQKQTYKDAAAAKKAVDYSFDDGGKKVDLGKKITGYQQGAAGSTYLNWKEGKWSIVVRASNVEGQDPTDTAKALVTYLDKAALPAPKDVGQVTIDLAGSGNERNKVVWQNGKTVYTVTHEDAKPALEMAVSMAK